MYREKLTGRSRHRTDEEGKLVLQVEYTLISRAPPLPSWRDAKVEDLLVRDTLPEVT